VSPCRDFHDGSLLVAALSGAIILGASFVLSWAAEPVQRDISQVLAVALFALTVVLPEYAVDAVFGLRPAFLTLSSGGWLEL
jgi:cation:H+ antiporter